MLRRLGQTDILVSSVALGCWPISGMTSLGVTEAESLATLDAALECGVNFFDTAYCYGANGESERLIGRAIKGRRERVVIATKGGIHWGPKGERILDGRPETLRRECDESLRRLGIGHIDLLYLHGPDPTIPIRESAGGLHRLLDEGKTRAIGVSNATVGQLEEFVAECPVAAVQPPYNLLQRQIEADLLPWSRSRGISVVPYWPLMKGLLAGKLSRNHQFAPGDGRAKYPMFQGEEWRKNQDFLDRLREIANEARTTVSQVAVNWVISQPGVASALCGAKRPDQIRETAGAMDWQLTKAQFNKIDAALRERGKPVVKAAV